MKKYHVLQTPSRFYPSQGGVEQHLYYLCRELVKRDIKVTVICADDPCSDLRNIDGIGIVRLPYLNKVANTNITLRLPFVLFKSNFDIIHTHMPTPWSADWSVFIAKIKKKKAVITIHNDMSKDSKLFSFLLYVYLHSFFILTLSLVDKIIVVNPDWEECFSATKHILRLYKSKIEIIPNGVDTKIFRSIDSKKKKRLLFISLLDEFHKYKGLDILLDSIVKVKNRIPGVRLDIVGGGSLLPYYIKMVNKKHLNSSVFFHGSRDQRDLSKFYSKASALVMPSIYNEGFGIVLLEAMACATPVITTKITGVAKDILKYSTGYVLNSITSPALSDSIVELFSNSKKIRVMGRNGLRLVHKYYTWEKISSKVFTLYQHL